MPTIPTRRPRHVSRLLTSRLLTSTLAAGLAACLLGAGCANVGLAPNEMNHEAVVLDPGTVEPEHIVVEHCLIGVDVAELPGVSRSVEEARRLATQVLDQARRGAEFADLVKRYSDDRGGDGIYAMVNFGLNPVDSTEVPRGKMVRAFGDVSFGLAVGEFGMTEYDTKRSKYGFHVIHRLR